MTVLELVIFLARQCDYVTESAEENAGQRVEGIQRWSGGVRGESWCGFFVTMILDLAYKGKAPVARQGGVEVVRQFCKASGFLVSIPLPGDLFVYVNPANRGHHIGFYVSGPPDRPVGIAGNTSANGMSSNGKQVAEHILNAGAGTIEYFHYAR